MNLVLMLVAAALLVIVGVLILRHMLTEGRKGRRWSGLTIGRGIFITDSATQKAQEHEGITSKGDVLGVLNPAAFATKKAG